MNAIMRRSALRAVGLVGLACIAGKAAMATPEQDAEIIRVCDELLANKAEFDALFSRRVSIQDEERTNPELEALSAREAEIQDRLSDLPPPSTLAGAQAMARVAVSRWWMLNGEDELYAEDFDSWGNLSILQFLAETGA